MLALWKLDLAFADVISTTLTPQLGQIRLAWWRERLEELDRAIRPPAEPRLQAVAAILIPEGISGVQLARLEYCWLALLTPFPWDDLVADALIERGKILFGIGALLLGRDPAEGEPFGAFWALEDGARHCSDPQSSAYLRDRAKSVLADLPRGRVSRALDPLMMIVVRRACDLLYGKGHRRQRMMAGLRYALFGSLPR